MATTVNQAFAEFLRDTVNLDPSDSKGAKASRAWLRGQLQGFNGTDSTCPAPYPDVDIDYGSFDRKTKLRPLDDVDLIHGLHADSATYLAYSNAYVTITTQPGSTLARYRHENSSLLNSRRVINKFIALLNGVSQYKDAADRDGVAARLELSSYDWNFDIVPGFFTAPETDGRTYYIIPNGSGHWMKTDPRLDRGRVSRVDAEHKGRVLNVVRLLKYWNRRPTMPSVPSYAFETLLIDYYDKQTYLMSEWVDVEVAPVLEYVASAIYSSIADSKGLQGNLNTLDFSSMMKVSARASSDAAKARQARQLESAGNHKASIAKWGEIFGPDFPSYSG